MNQFEKKESKSVRDEVSPSIRDFISNFRKQQAQQAKQNAYQQSIKKTIPIQQITQLKQNRQSVDTQTDLEEQQSEQLQKRNSVQSSHRQQSTYTQSSLTTREVQVQCEDQKQKWICQDEYPSARVNIHYLNNHFQSIQSQQSDQTSSNTYQQMPFIYRSPQKLEQEVNLDEMTEKILNKVIKELDKRNNDNTSLLQSSTKKSLSVSKQNNLSITNQTVSLSVLPQPKNEDEDSFIKFIQMSLVNKNKILYDDQENQPPTHVPLQQYSTNLPKQREQHSKSTLNKIPFTESSKSLYNRANTNTKSSAHQRLYQDACMRQERRTLAVVRKMKF